MMMAASSLPCVAVRGSEGVWMQTGTENSHSNDFRDNCQDARVMCYSDDGKLFAWNNGKQGIIVISTCNNSMITRIAKPKTIYMKFSPKGTYLVTWESYFVLKGQQQGDPNLNIWNVESGEIVRNFIQKKSEGWCPQWTNDEHLCARNVTNEVHFFEANDFSVIKEKLRIEKLSEFSLSKKGPPYHVAAYIPGSKGQPSFVRLFAYPDFSGPSSTLANKSFYKADKVTIHWNGTGTAVLVLTSTEASDASYYGDQGLHFLSVTGECSLVPLNKNGPVYHVEWNPKHPEFCVVYGFMPAKATLFNMKCEAIFDFGTGPRNIVYYNPQGTLLTLAGFGNLRGNIEMWDPKKKKLASKFEASDTTLFQWCPDGEHILTATTAPRLRVGNGLKMWHYSGKNVHKQTAPDNHFYYDVMWQPVADGVYGPKPIRYNPEGTYNAPGTLADKIPQVYRPPSARGTVSTLKLHECEPPSNVKGSEEPLSKAALKNKKKREAKQRAKQEQTDAQPEFAQQAESIESPVSPGNADPEKIKKIRNLNKKLEQIDKLKQKKAEGAELELNQLEKLKTEGDLRHELERLKIS